MATIDGIINEPSVNFVGRDGFFWWVGEVEDNEDPILHGWRICTDAHCDWCLACK